MKIRPVEACDTPYPPNDPTHTVGPGGTSQATATRRDPIPHLYMIISLVSNGKHSQQSSHPTLFELPGMRARMQATLSLGKCRRVPKFKTKAKRGPQCRPPCLALVSAEHPGGTGDMGRRGLRRGPCPAQPRRGELSAAGSFDRSDTTIKRELVRLENAL